MRLLLRPDRCIGSEVDAQRGSRLGIDDEHSHAELCHRAHGLGRARGAEDSALEGPLRAVGSRILSSGFPVSRDLASAVQREIPMTRQLFALAVTAFLGSATCAQEPVTGVTDRAALFHSSDPLLDARKQVVYHIYTDVFENNRVDLVDAYMTERYIQHNPNIASGRDAVK